MNGPYAAENNGPGLRKVNYSTFRCLSRSLPATDAKGTMTSQWRASYTTIAEWAPKLIPHGRLLSKLRRNEVNHASKFDASASCLLPTALFSDTTAKP